MTSKKDGVFLYRGDTLNWYDKWESPVVIVSDGPYRLGSYPGDPSSPEQLAEMYEPHITKWSEHATPLTTLWLLKTILLISIVNWEIDNYGTLV